MTDKNYDIEKIRDYFKDDHYLVAAGISILEAGEDSAVLAMDLSEMHYNAGGAVQGGAVYTLADSAFAVASNAAHITSGEKKVTVNQSSSISYMKATKGSRLLGYAEKIGGGKKMSVYRICIADDLGTEVAIMTGNGYTVDLKG